MVLHHICFYVDPQFPYLVISVSLILVGTHELTYYDIDLLSFEPFFFQLQTPRAVTRPRDSKSPLKATTLTTLPTATPKKISPTPTPTLMPTPSPTPTPPPTTTPRPTPAPTPTPKPATTTRRMTTVSSAEMPPKVLLLFPLPLLSARAARANRHRDERTPARRRAVNPTKEPAASAIRSTPAKAADPATAPCPHPPPPPPTTTAPPTATTTAAAAGGGRDTRGSRPRPDLVRGLDPGLDPTRARSARPRRPLPPCSSGSRPHGGRRAGKTSTFWRVTCRGRGLRGTVVAPVLLRELRPERVSHRSGWIGSGRYVGAFAFVSEVHITDCRMIHVIRCLVGFYAVTAVLLYSGVHTNCRCRRSSLRVRYVPVHFILHLVLDARCYNTCHLKFELRQHEEKTTVPDYRQVYLVQCVLGSSPCW